MTTQPSENPSSLTPRDPDFLSWIWMQPSEIFDVSQWQENHATQASAALESSHTAASFVGRKPSPRMPDFLAPLRTGINKLNVRQPRLAHFICRTIPTQCPFERNIQLFGKTLFHIPPLCKLNPLYDEVVGLRFRALCYLADECGEDVTVYC